MLMVRPMHELAASGYRLSEPLIWLTAFGMISLKFLRAECVSLDWLVVFTGLNLQLVGDLCSDSGVAIHVVLEIGSFVWLSDLLTSNRLAFLLMEVAMAVRTREVDWQSCLSVWMSMEWTFTAVLLRVEEL